MDAPRKEPRLIGILGGSSPAITPSYHDMINAGTNARLGGHYLAETIITGMNFGIIVDFIYRDDWDGLAAYVGRHADRLEAAGADLIACVSNTVHQVMRQVMEGRTAEFVAITDPLIAAIKASGIKRVALFGTRMTMNNSAVMQEVAERAGVDVLVPREDERDDINRVIFSELAEHKFKPASKQRYLDIAHRMKREEGAEGVILGCTEIFLLIDEPDLPDMHVFATARLHAEAIVARAFAT